MKTLTVFSAIIITAVLATEPLVMVETSSGPLGDLFELLDYITEEINSESLESESISSKILAQCKEEIEFRKDQMLKHQSEYQETRLKNDRCKQDSSLLESKLQKLSKDIKTIESNAKNIEYSQITYEKSFGVIDHCIDLLGKLKNSPSSLIQLGKTAGQLLALDASSEVHSIVTSLTELSSNSKADQSSISLIIDKLQKLKVSLKETRFDDQTVETRISEKSSKLSSYLKSALETALSDKDQTQSLYADSIVCIKRSSESMKNSQEKISSEQRILDLNSLLCSDWEAEYQDLKSQRAKELDVIKTLISLNEKAWGDYSKTAVDRADFYKEEWDNYSNEYVYKSQYGYQHDQADFLG